MLADVSAQHFRFSDKVTGSYFSGVVHTDQGLNDAAVPPCGDDSGGPGSAAGLTAGPLDSTESPQLPQRCGVSAFIN